MREGGGGKKGMWRGREGEERWGEYVRGRAAVIQAYSRLNYFKIIHKSPSQCVMRCLACEDNRIVGIIGPLKEQIT